jgi:hypothetical protein
VPAAASTGPPSELARTIKLTAFSNTTIMRGYWLCIMLVFAAHLLPAAIPLNGFHTKPWYLCGGGAGGGGGAVEQYGKILLSLSL